LYFEVLDNKIECYGFYANNDIHNTFPDDGSVTWSYSSNIPVDNVEFVSLYVGGKDINEVCPPELKESWTIASDRLKAYLRSFLTAKINMEQNCFYDLVPERFLIEYFSIKSKITQWVHQNYKKPDNYEFLVQLSKFVEQIKRQKLNIDTSSLMVKIANPRVRNMKNKIDEMDPVIKYNPFGTITGRLATVHNSFPILSLDKQFRSVIHPNNDWFVELDFNGAELRTFLALAGKNQPDCDIHDWNVTNLFNGELDRDKAKEQIFAWLYGSDKKNEIASKIYDRDAIRDKYWNGYEVRTPYDRVIPSDRHHAMSYLIQSTFSDIVLRQIIKVNEYLKDKKSKISFCVHDNVVIDLHDDEKKHLKEIIKIFSDTDYGSFRVNIKVGNDYGSMKTLTKN